MPSLTTDVVYDNHILRLTPKLPSENQRNSYFESYNSPSLSKPIEVTDHSIIDALKEIRINPARVHRKSTFKMRDNAMIIKDTSSLSSKSPAIKLQPSNTKSSNKIDSLDKELEKLHDAIESNIDFDIINNRFCIVQGKQYSASDKS